MQIRQALWPLLSLVLVACASVPDAYEQPKATIKAELESAKQPAPASANTDAASKALYPSLKLDLPASAVKIFEPRFDVIVNNTPAHQVLLSIVADTRYSMLLPNDLAGNITVNLKNVTVPEAMAALKQLYNIEYKIDGTRIYVQAQKLQTRVMKVNYLNAIRSGTSGIRVLSGSVSDSSTSSSNQNNSNNNNNNNSGSNSQQSAFVTSRISTTVESNFWPELAQSVKMILGDGEGRNVVVSPQSGILVVRAMPNELAEVEAFLKASQLSLERQVIIEAKIMEVTLGNEFQAGINWAAFSGERFSVGVVGQGSTINNSGALTTSPVSGTPGTSLANAANAANTASTMFGMVLRGGSFAAALNLLEQQGKVHVLSSPRVATLNNQKAVLKVGTDDFFVTGVDSTSTTGSNGNVTVTPKITLQAFFSGISLDVTPQIDSDDQITLHVHPMISDVTTRTQTVNIGSDLYSMPTASSQISEMDSVVKAVDGQMVALGGLIRQRSVTTDTQVPWLGSIPGIGNLFKQKSQEMQKRELVILIKPMVVQSGAGWNEDISQSDMRIKRLLDTDNSRVVSGENKANNP